MATPTRKREEGDYIPPGHPSTMAALERWQALPPEQRAERRDEGLALRDAYVEGFGTPPPEDVAFSRPDGTRWAVEQAEGAAPASMADLRRMDDAPPVAAAPSAGPEQRPLRTIRLPEMRIDTTAPASAPTQGTAPTPRRPMVDVSQVGQADAGSLFERLAAAGRAPAQPTTPGQGINPEVRAFVEKRAAPVDGLQQAQDEERNRRLAEAIWRTGAGINTAITGAKAPEGVDFDVEGPKREFAERQAEDARKTEVARQSALRDPNSSESIRQRAALKAVLPNVPDEVLAGVTAENAGSLFDRLKFGASEAARREAAANEAARYTDAREERRLDNANAERRFQAQLAESRAGRQASADLQRELAGMSAKERAALAEEKRQLSLGEKQVGGFTFDPKNPPSDDAAKKMATAAIARDQIINSLGRLERIYAANGSEIFGATAGEMESEWMNITNKLRVLNEMGVPNGADYAMLAKQLTDPTSMRGLFTSKDRQKEQFSALRDQVRRTVDATAKAYKFRPSGDGAANADRPDVDLTQSPAPSAAAPKQLADVPFLSLSPGQKLSDAIQEGQVYRVRTKNGVRLMAKRGGELVYED